MKVILSNAIWILLSLFAVSCTEEIADEVQNKTTSASETEISDYSTRSIRLVHKMDENLSYLMHKSGNSEADCELKAPTAGFDADDYDYTSSSYTIDCVLDVEELDLKSNGVSIELQIDDQLCEYVKYIPYSFFRFQPGSTKRDSYQVTCDSVCAEDATHASKCDQYYDTFVEGANLAADVFSSKITDFDKNKCFFDYTSIHSGSDWSYFPNCDEGEYYLHTVALSASDNGTPNDDSDDVCDTSTFTENSESTDCGGSAYNCIGGAARDEFSDNSHYYTVTPNTDLKAFTKTWTYSSSFTDKEYGWSNYKLANYSRICAESGTTKVSGDALTGTGSTGNYSSIVLNGSEVEEIRLANGLGSGNLYRSDYSTVRTTNDTTTERIYLADNLFRGSERTNPYYGFYCLDKAFDVKAQVRLFIREWDRKFEHTNTYINYTSDTFLTSPLMDAGFTKQSTYEYWNDYADLDDFLENDSDNDYEIDTYIFSNNQCGSSTTAFDYGDPANSDYGNFPGSGGLSSGVGQYRYYK